MKNKLFVPLLYCLIWAITGSVCTKYLDAKPNKAYEVPQNLQDGQALIDYYIRINKDAGAGEASADNYYLTDSTYATLSSDYYKRMYIWEKDQLFAPENNDWANLYYNVYTANTVLDLVSKVNRDDLNASDWDNLKGQALFLRARSFFQTATTWCLSYDSLTASSDPGIPLRLDINFNEVSVRSSNQQTYDQILNDLKQSAPLLPVNPVNPVRSSRPAAYGLLARVYMSMRNYDSSLFYSNLALQLKSDLLDYNTLDPTDTYPFGLLQYQNPEIIFESNFIPLLLNSFFADIDSTLHASYQDNDLRKQIYFAANPDGSFKFKGSYEGNLLLYSGIATDECYLMRAECYARKGMISQAMNDLNALMIKRWKNDGSFVPATAADQADAVNQILTERRKELPMRGLRWIDLKRLNKENANIALSRTVDGQVYTLPPNDLRYALPIPEDVIAESGMQQNPR